MGYTTKFTGKLTFSKSPPPEALFAIMDLDGADGRQMEQPNPGSYCQWVLTKDRMGLEWNRGEKFYEYEAWLEYIYVHHLKPHGVELLGELSFQGEETDDCGTLTFENGKAVKRTLELVRDELEELKRFRDYALESDYAEEIKGGWKSHKERR